jgi:hypothetical protein
VNRYFALPTANPARLVIHCTINRREHEPDFVESIELFLDPWGEGWNGSP